MNSRHTLAVILAAIVAGTSLGATRSARADYQEGLEAYQRGEYAAARAEFEALAERGVVLAYTNLGYMAALGEGGKADMAAAARWFERAARAGDAASQLTLGVMFYNAEGLPYDPVRSFAWLSLAGAAGYDEALDYLELVRERLDEETLDRSYRLARELLREHGDPEIKRLAADGWIIGNAPTDETEDGQSP